MADVVSRQVVPHKVDVDPELGEDDDLGHAAQQAPARIPDDLQPYSAGVIC